MRIALLLGILFLGMTSGCQRADAGRPVAGVVAKVNGTEISAQQLASAQALESVIERELLVQKALAGGLDRDPAVAQSLDNARRQVLAQAYVEKVSSQFSKPSVEEVRGFYAENPALFAGRRVYRLQELVVSAPAELVDVLRAEAARTRDLEQISAWLRSRDARFSATALTQAAEQLPLSQLPQIARMKAGEIAVFPTPLGASVVQLVHAEPAPLSEQQAAPLIEQFLAGRKRLEVAAAEVRRLRESARIEYVGDFKAR
jgi:EpsD family peptidyl-prolyl cis-trans isomerase